MQHELKCWPEYFAAIVSGLKTFEVRVNDRDYQVGDELRLREWEPQRFDPRCPRHVYILADEGCSCGSAGSYTGNEFIVSVPYLTDFGQRANHVVMAINPVQPWEDDEE